jgi:hypothetical protein
MAKRKLKKKNKNRYGTIIIFLSLIAVMLFFIGFTIGFLIQPKVIYKELKCPTYVSGIWTQVNLTCPTNINDLIATSTDDNVNYQIKCENNRLWIQIPSAEDYKVTNFYLYYKLEEKNATI